MISLYLPGRLLAGATDETFKNIKKESGLVELKKEEDGVSLLGGRSSVLKALPLLKEFDVIVPECSHKKSLIEFKPNELGITWPEVRGAFRNYVSREVSSKFSAYPWGCDRFGRHSYLKETPKTTNSQIEAIPVELNKCYECMIQKPDRYRFCLNVSQLTKAEEGHWKEEV